MSVPENFDEFCNWVVGGIAAIESKVGLTEDQMINSQMFEHLSNARENAPQGQAHWEIAAFYGWAVAASVALLQWGRITDFRQYEKLMVLIFGSAVRPHLSSVFAASALSPALDSDFGSDLLSTLSYLTD